jgi:hypothetical protein
MGMVLAMVIFAAGGSCVKSLLHHSEASRAVARGVHHLERAGASPASSPNAPCHIGGSGDFIRPDNFCTPGTFDRLSRSQACVHKERPSLSATAKRRIFRQYGFSSWTGRNGEIDHRIPFFLGGRTERLNLWPEAGTIPNTKDKLEFEVYDRVCDQGTMTVAQAVVVFRGDWTKAYRKYVAS